MYATPSAKHASLAYVAADRYRSLPSHTLAYVTTPALSAEHFAKLCSSLSLILALFIKRPASRHCADPDSTAVGLSDLAFLNPDETLEELLQRK